MSRKTLDLYEAGLPAMDDGAIEMLKGYAAKVKYTLYPRLTE